MTYMISPEKRKLFDKLLDLLKEFNRVCEENDIKYYVYAGTMLGAIRHNGFIPWDDDVDVCLPREDYDRLKRIAADGAFRKPYFFQSPNTDKGYHKGFCRLRNSNTTEIPYMDFEMKCNHGIFIDIFPLDKVPNDNKAFAKQLRKMRLLRSLLNAYARYYSGIGREATTVGKKVAYTLIVPCFRKRILTGSQIYDKFEHETSKYKNYQTEKIGIIACTFDNERAIFDSKFWNGKTIRVKFEDMLVPVPEQYEKILRHSYGNYMTPVQEITNHGDVVFSTTIPYEDYIKDHYADLKNGWYKQKGIHIIR